MEGAEKNGAVNQLSISMNDRKEARLLTETELRGGGPMLSQSSLALVLSSHPLMFRLKSTTVFVS